MGDFMAAFPEGRPVSGHVVATGCRRPAPFKRTRLGASLYADESSAQCSALDGLKEHTVRDWKVSFVARQNSLRSLRDHAVVGAERAYGNRPSCKLVAAARKKFDAEPYRAVVA